MHKITLFIVALLIISCSICDNITVNEELTTQKILFIGSSYFVYNDLPELFRELATAGGKDVLIDSRIILKTYLEDHADMQKTEDMINQDDWNFVVLQGVGSLMAYPDYFVDHPVAPALIKLKEKILSNSSSTKIVFCLPWAYEDGMTWLEGWTDTYTDMQIKINDTTLDYADDMGFDIAPVGVAWHKILEEQNYPLHYLHLNDWNHPSPKGSYLMANVIYSTIFQESINDISYYAGLPEEEAHHFQLVASFTVLDDLDLWLND